MQMETLECGAAALAMIMAYYGKWMPLEQVRLDCGVSRDGASAQNIANAARSYGMDAQGFVRGLDALRETGPFPCIIAWKGTDYVVLDGFKGNYAFINDPAKGSRKITIEEFEHSYKGICLTFTPTDEFVPGGKRKSTVEFARNRLKGAGTAVAFVALTTLIAYLFEMVSPAFSRFFLDHLLTGENSDLLMPFIGLMTVVAVLQVIMTAAKSIYSLKINGKMAIVGSSMFMWKVLRMPMEFFSQRLAGDIQQRKMTNAVIAETLVNTFTPLALNIVMMLFYLVVMIRYSVLLTAVGIAAIVINSLLASYISRKRVNITRVQMRDSGKLEASTVSGIQMIETIKASGAENGYFAKWAGYQASVNTATTQFANLNLYLGMVPSFLASLANYAVLVIGVFLVMQGQFSLGMVMAFQGYIQLFMNPAMTTIKAGQTLQEMRTQMERIDDVMQYPEDPNYRDEPLEDDTEYDKLDGEVELKNITFGYARLSEPVIKDFSMTVEPGMSVALVGSSGCGKSTISKLIAGLYQPWNGEILFDGKPISEIDRSVFTSSVAVVDQDIILFEDTIANNIRMWDESIEDFEVIMAARDAQIHDDIMAREGGYAGKVAEGGRDLSGGQRQRLEIARVLAADPHIVVMDEATSALDAKTEFELVQAVKDRGITCIIIAHRLSTIRDCDEIIVLDHGEVVERGTHDELYALGGAYAELVSND
ncbi:MAG: NHLP family bacteriocin export ABC transporter peptidase/permease/ATPase subunit [Eggerthellaceae bacterium]|nr:NHLP family bacteriocin export ABC transporter peptidase/permease/ATPase subunit [Eggerthellaceae bacterium]